MKILFLSGRFFNKANIYHAQSIDGLRGNFLGALKLGVIEWATPSSENGILFFLLCMQACPIKVCYLALFINS